MVEAMWRRRVAQIKIGDEGVYPDIYREGEGRKGEGI